MPSRLDHGVTATVGADQSLQPILLSRMLLIIVILDSRLSEVNPLEHHNIFLNLPRLLILA